MINNKKKKKILEKGKLYWDDYFECYIMYVGKVNKNPFSSSAKALGFHKYKFFLINGSNSTIFYRSEEWIKRNYELR